MENVRLNIAYDLLLKKTKLSFNPIRPESEENTAVLPVNHIYFVICNSCYWCASYFGIDNLESLSSSSSHVIVCHACNSHNTEIVPIGTDESFRIECNHARGMEIEFYNNYK